MLFELRTDIPEVSDGLIDLRDHFLSGRTRQSAKIVKSIRGQNLLQTPNDFLLIIEILRACGIYKQYLATIRIAHRRFPQHRQIQFYYCRMLLARGRHMMAIEFLQNSKPDDDDPHRGLWCVQMADAYAEAGFGDSCQRWLLKAASYEGFDSAISLYTRSCAQEALRNWDAAIDLAQRYIQLAPKWTRSHVHFVGCLLSRGRLEDALKQIQWVKDHHFEEAYIDFTLAAVECALGNFKSSAELFRACVKDWPDASFVSWAKRTLYVLAVENGDADAAHEIYQLVGQSLGLPAFDDVDAGAKHTFIPIPLIAQQRSQCVPTTVAMATYPAGFRFAPDELYRQMQGRNGTPLWRMRNWVEENGFTFVPVKLAADAVTGLLDRGVPLIGVMQQVFSSHVDVVCGYNDGLDVFYVRDPYHWAPMVYPKSMCLQRYELDNGVVAIIPKSETETIEFAQRYRSYDMQSLIDLQQAVDAGDQVAAESAAAAIDDQSPTAFLRDTWGVTVSISHQSFQQRMQEVANDPDANATARFRAITSLGIESFESVYQQLIEKEPEAIGRGGRLYLEMVRDFRAGLWQSTQNKLRRLMISNAQSVEYWSLKSDLHSELGQHQESVDAINLAIELAPEDYLLREKAIQQQAQHLTYVQYAAVMDAMIEQFPDERRLLWAKVVARQDGPDGRALESALQAYLRWHPRDIKAWSGLASWYSSQKRNDLYDATMAQARELMPESFDAPQVDRSSSENNDASPDQPTAQMTDPLPAQRASLLQLAWTTSAPQHDAAVEELTRLESADRLSWLDHADFLVARIIASYKNGISTLDDVASLLPSSPPGPCYRYVESVLEIASGYSLCQTVATNLIRWVDQVAGDYRNHVGLWFSRIVVLEMTGAIEAALAELESLLETFPAHSSSLYRMGVLKRQQGQLSVAVDFFERALEVNPGLYGAMEQLYGLHRNNENAEQAFKYLRQLRTKMPYEFDFIAQDVLQVAELQSAQSAKELLETVKSDCPPHLAEILQLRLAIKLDELDRANEICDQLLNNDPLVAAMEKDDDVFEELLQSRLTLATATQNRQLIDELCEMGIQRWPNSSRLKLIRFNNGFGDHRELIRDVIVQGQGDEEMAFQFLIRDGVARDTALEDAKSLIQDAAQENGLQVAELFCGVVRWPELVHLSEPFLVWAKRKFPDSLLIKYRLAEHYNLSGKLKPAIEIAKKMHQDDPDNVDLMRMYGRFLVDVDAKQALPILKKVCQNNRSVEGLFDLARCYQLAGDLAQSGKTHREILEVNPYVGASVVSLFLLGDDNARLWNLSREIVKRGSGDEDEYFLVACVKLARIAKQTLPDQWLVLAKRRAQTLNNRPGFGDEKSKLNKAIGVWESIRRPDVKWTGYLRRKLMRLTWPGTHWVPKE